MKNITRIFMFSLSLLTISQIFTNCKKDPSPVEPNFLDTHTIAEGIVLEYETLKPIPNAKVILRECENEIFQGSFCGPIDTFITNSDGKYFIDFEHKNSGGGAIFEAPSFSYELRVAADNYFLNRSNQLYLKKEHVNQDTAVMDPHGWIKFHVKNVVPFDENDEIRGQFETPEINGGWASHFGQDVDTTSIIIVRGNRDETNLWNITKNGIKQNFRDTIYVPAFDTILHEIFY